MMKGKLRGDTTWTPIEGETLDSIASRYFGHGFTVIETTGAVTIINPVTNEIECEYQEEAAQ